MGKSAFLGHVLFLDLDGRDGNCLNIGLYFVITNIAINSIEYLCCRLYYYYCLCYDLPNCSQNCYYLVLNCLKIVSNRMMIFIVTFLGYCCLIIILHLFLSFCYLYLLHYDCLCLIVDVFI